MRVFKVFNQSLILLMICSSLFCMENAEDFIVKARKHIFKVQELEKESEERWKKAEEGLPSDYEDAENFMDLAGKEYVEAGVNFQKAYELGKESFSAQDYTDFVDALSYRAVREEINVENYQARSLELLKEGLSRYPEHIGLYLKTSTYEAMNGNYDKSQALLEDALEIDSGNTEVLMTLMQLHFRTRSMEKIKELAERIIEIDSENAQAYEALIYYYSSIGDQENMNRCAQWLIEKFPENERYQEYLERAQETHQKVAEGEEELLKNPDNPELMTKVAESYIESGNADKALNLLKKANELAPENGDILALYGIIGLQMAFNDSEKLTEAVKVMELAVERNADREITIQGNKLSTFDLNQFLVQAYMKLKDLSKAAEILESMIKDRPGDQYLYSMLVEIYKELGEEEKSERASAKLNEIQDTERETQEMQEMAWEMRDSGEYQLALETYTEILERLNPQDVYMRMQINEYISELYGEAGLEDKASEYSLKAASLGAEQVENGMYYMLDDVGSNYVKAGEYEKAEKALLKCVEMSPENATCYLGLVDLYKETGENEKRLEAALKAAEIYPDGALHRAELGCAYLELGEMDKAITEMEEAAALGSDREDILEKVAYAYYIAGNKEKSEEWLDIAKMEAESGCSGRAGYFPGEAIIDFLIEEQEIDEAINMAQKAEEYYAENTDILNKLGMLHFKKKNYDKSLEYYDKAYLLSSNNLVAVTGLATTYESLKDWDNAVKYYGQLVDIEKSLGSDRHEKALRNVETKKTK